MQSAGLQGAGLQGANLLGAFLQGADLQDTGLLDLQDPDLLDANLQYVEKEKLQEILDKHAKWLNNEVGGVRADLRGADLRGAGLPNALLQGADLQGAFLQGADLQYADLQDTDLQDAGLQYAFLHGAGLRGADLRGADLRGADLQGTSLSWVNWHEAENIRVYVAGLQSSRENAQLTYIPSIDVATTGSWQGSWQETIDWIHSVYAEGTQEQKAYDLAIEYIQAQMELDNVEADE